MTVSTSAEVDLNRPDAPCEALITLHFDEGDGSPAMTMLLPSEARQVAEMILAKVAAVEGGTR